MKTKVLFLILMIGSTIFGLSAQNVQNRILDRILHFEQFVHHLQNRQVNQATIRLDSIVSKNFDATNGYTLGSLQSFLYDANDRNTNDSYNIWDAANNALKVQSKSDYTYTSNGFIETETNYYFDFNSNSLIPSQKKTYTYNSDSQLTMMVSQNYDVNVTSFVNSSRETYSYQSTTDPKPNSVLIESWDTANSAWVLNQLGTVTYNGNFQFTDIVMQNRDVPNNIWVNNMHFARTYDTNSRLTEYLIESWDTASSAWVNNNKKTFTYTTSGTGTNTLQKFFTWDTANASWKLQGKTIYDIDNNNNFLKQENYYLDGGTNTLIGSVEMVYTYNGAQVTLEYFQWDAANNTWKTDSFNKSEYNYDNNVDKSDLILPYTYSYSNLTNSLFSTGMPGYDELHHKLLFRKSFSRATASDPWLEGFKTEYKYTDTAAGIDETVQIDAKIYPVPFDNYIKIHTENDNYQLKIMDLNGRILHAGKHLNNERISLNHLTKGVYIYHIITDKGQTAGQIIKK